MMKSALLTLCLTLAGCTGGEKVQGAPAPGDVVQIAAVEWRVVDQATLVRLYTESGMDLRKEDKLEGFTARDLVSGRLVIYTTPPRVVDDQVTCTVGHEMLHVALGDYHARK